MGKKTTSTATGGTTSCSAEVENVGEGAVCTAKKNEKDLSSMTTESMATTAEKDENDDLLDKNEKEKEKEEDKKEHKHDDEDMETNKTDKKKGDEEVDEKKEGGKKKKPNREKKASSHHHHHHHHHGTGGCCGDHHHFNEDDADNDDDDDGDDYDLESIEKISITPDDGVIKQIVRKGYGRLPENGEEVEVHYIGKLVDGKIFDSSRKRGTPFKFLLGEGQVIKGWDMSVATMHIGERAILTIKPEYGYGDSGAGADIPPNSTLIFDVEVYGCNIKEVNIWDMSMEERINKCIEAKEKGNDFYKKNLIEDAIKQYLKGLEYFEGSEEWPDEEKRKKYMIEISLRLNLSQCYILQKMYAQAYHEANFVLSIDPYNTKAYYRRGTALGNLGFVTDAKKDLFFACKQEPKNQDLRNAYENWKKLSDISIEKERRSFSKLFKQESLYTEKKNIRSLASLPHAYMDIQIGDDDKNIQRITFVLYSDTVPSTAKNFLALCTGEKGEKDGVKLCYKGHKFHRIIKNFMMQGGDIEADDGTGGKSIYGDKFPDENFVDQHESRGLLSMANCGPNTNGSQFFITFGPASHLDGKHVVFGEIVDGWQVLDAVEAIETEDEKPTKDIVIVDCGKL